VAILAAEVSEERVYGQSLAGIAGSNPAGGHRCLSVRSVVCLSGRGLCDGLITCPQEANRLWCVSVCDLESSRIRRPWPALGL
jgi:hypothetical protein